MLDTNILEKKNAKEVISILKSDLSRGLSNTEAEHRLSEYGYNEIPEKKSNPVLIFLSKFYGPVQALLWLVIFLSYLLNHMRTFYIVIALLIFNAIVSFFEEYKADKSIEALKKRLAQNARVLRSGSWITVKTRLLVPGDIIRIRLGDIVPADAKIISTEDLEIDESIITGESLPVSKMNNNVVYSGSTVKRGEATCIVVGTGMNTFYGKTAELIERAKPKSHLEEVVMNIVRYLMYADAIILLLLFIYGFFLLHIDLPTLIPFLLVIFIASVPVALSAAFTVAMALGTEKLAKKSVLVTKLESLENTATMNILCMDKTGTLTQNKITVKDIAIIGKHTKDEIIKYASEASRREDNDPIDNAIIDYTEIYKIKTNKQIFFKPFDPLIKRTYAYIDDKKKYYTTKGAAQVVFQLCRLNSIENKKAFEKVAEFAHSGYRTIAVAVSKDNKKWDLVGLIALHDEPRPQAKPLIAELKNLGVMPKMLTGDNIAVAREVSSELGIGENVIDMNTINRNSKSFNRDIIEANGFANVFPKDKYDIVNALQIKNNIVGMTGDGVNDAPALKQADVGIAVANATDVAKSSAALVLTENGINVIVDAIKESRRIFERMVVYTETKISKVFQIISVVAIIFIVFKFMPITPFLLILLLFTNDITNISVSTDNAIYSSSPDIWNVKRMVTISAILGISLVLQGLLLIPICFSIFNMSVAAFQTSLFLLFDISDKFVIFNLRTRKEFWKLKPSSTLFSASLIGIIIGILFAYYGVFITQISMPAILFITLIALIFFFIDDIIKIAVFNFFDRKDARMRINKI